MKTPAIEITNELNNDIKGIAKRNGMKKEEWLLWAIIEMVRQVKEIEAKIASRTVEETKKLLEDREHTGLHIENSVPPYPDNLSDELKEKLSGAKTDNSAMSYTEGADVPNTNEPDHALQNQEIIDQLIGNPAVKETGSTNIPDLELNKTIQPLDENGTISIPSYTFYMTDGGEQKVDAKSLGEAVNKLGLMEDDYFDYKVTE